MIPEPLLELWSTAKPFFDMIYPNFSAELPGLVVMVLAIAVYAIVIYHFYRFLAKRDVFGFDSKKYKTEKIGFFHSLFNAFIGFVEYGILFPIVVFLWLSGFSIMLFLLARNIDIAQVLLVSVVFVAAIRLTAYYTENLSKDLAKMVPLALLGIAIVDPNFFSLEIFFDRISGLGGFIIKIAGYFAFIIMLEWALRILLGIKHLLFGVRQKTPPEAQA